MAYYSILADLHTHTIASGHAYSTLLENMTHANDIVIRFVATTDHFYYKDDKIDRLNEFCRVMDTRNIKSDKGYIIAGVEGNLGHFLDKEHAQAINQNIKWRLVGYHSWFVDAGKIDIAKTPKMFLDTIQNPDVFIKPTAFAHIERHIQNFARGDDISIAKGTLRDIVNIAIENNIFLEINEHSLSMGGDTVALMKDWVKYAKDRKAKFCLGSDAHYCEKVGRFDETIRFINDMDLWDSDILNFDISALRKLSNDD